MYYYYPALWQNGLQSWAMGARHPQPPHGANPVCPIGGVSDSLLSYQNIKSVSFIRQYKCTFFQRRFSLNNRSTFVSLANVTVRGLLLCKSSILMELPYACGLFCYLTFSCGLYRCNSACMKNKKYMKWTLVRFYLLLTFSTVELCRHSSLLQHILPEIRNYFLRLLTKPNALN